MMSANVICVFNLFSQNVFSYCTYYNISIQYWMIRFLRLCDTNPISWLRNQQNTVKKLQTLNKQRSESIERQKHSMNMLKRVGFHTILEIGQ